MKSDTQVQLKNKLTSEVVKTLPRLLTQLDRDELSPTFGCFDRNYWHYKIHDFSSIVLQQNVYALALLYWNDFPNNFLYKNKKTYSYVLGSLQFWVRSQHKNGTFDEYWPNEQGYPPLVFSTHAVLKTLMLFPDLKEEFRSPLKKAIHQIVLYQENNAVNQEVAGVSCLHLYALLYKDDVTLKNFRHRLRTLLAKQTTEGWFPEYGGADIGYSSVTLHFLSEISSHLQKNGAVQKSICKLVDFLEFFTHPDGTVGGEYGSRNTEYFLLNGLVQSAVFCPKSIELLQKINWTLDKFDDRYLFHYTFISFLDGFISLDKISFPKISTHPQQDFGRKYFDESGLLVIKKKSLYFITNLKKGGVFKLFNHNLLITQNSGYRIPVGKSFLVTNSLTKEAVVYIDKHKVSCSVPLTNQKIYISQPWQHMILRFTTFLPFKKWFINFLKGLLILNVKTSQYRFTRSFILSKNELIIEDCFSTDLPQAAFTHPESSLRFVPSSKFAQKESFPLFEEKFQCLTKGQNKSRTVIPI